MDIYEIERHHARLPFGQRHRASELIVGHPQINEHGHGGPQGWQRAAQRIIVKVDLLGALGVYQVSQSGRYDESGHAW